MSLRFVLHPDLEEICPICRYKCLDMEQEGNNPHIICSHCKSEWILLVAALRKEEG